ncbi:MAG: phage terminase large subunit [Armatimonadetes bacterium]|nr:phage terminase large subunit [Armatimonadota bacterium]
MTSLASWLQKDPKAALRSLDAHLARRSLAEFVRQGWPLLEPGTPLIWNWHLDAICEHLEAVTRGQIQRLLINIPPGHMKSLAVSVFWPAWEWVVAPETRSLFASYAMELAIRDSVRCRDLIQSDWYQEAFAPEWQLRGDQNLKSYFENTEKGFRFCLSVGGRATGFRGNKVVVDDPLNAKETYSESAREACLFWWDKVMSTRLNDPRTGTRVIIMQRLHESDLSGHVLKAGGYEHLCLPSEFDPSRRSRTCIGWEDPRREDGELLFPEVFTRPVLDQAKKDLGPIDYAGQHGQLPAPMEGAMFQAHWFRRAPAAPAKMDLVRYWDKAGAKPGKGDWTVGLLMGKDADRVYWIVDVVRGQWQADERNQVILETAKTDRQKYGRGRVHTYIEQPPGLAKESTDAVVRMLAGFHAEGDPVHRDKIERAEPVSSQARAGNLHLVEADWNAPYLAVMTVFPNGQHDDDVDATSGAFNKLAETQAPLPMDPLDVLRGIRRAN